MIRRLCVSPNEGLAINTKIDGNFQLDASTVAALLNDWTGCPFGSVILIETLGDHFRIVSYRVSLRGTAKVHEFASLGFFAAQEADHG